MSYYYKNIFLILNKFKKTLQLGRGVVKIVLNCYALKSLQVGAHAKYQITNM